MNLLKNWKNCRGRKNWKFVVKFRQLDISLEIVDNKNMDLLIFIVALSVLVLVHEWGHFMAAKINGVKVEEFGLGLPPRIFGKKIRRFKSQLEQPSASGGGGGGRPGLLGGRAAKKKKIYVLSSQCCGRIIHIKKKK